ncbi:MAG: porin family protein [Holosporaceae bacterium]|jgi:opacity protein-like surface antigen|nr:porin family protein [Holosporaceae bacterium]
MKKVLLAGLLWSVSAMADETPTVEADVVDPHVAEDSECASREKSGCSCGGIFFGGGIGGRFASNTATLYPVNRSGDFSGNLLTGSLVFGGGRCLNSWYVGGEALLDVAKNKNADVHLGNKVVRTRTGGLSTSLSLRCGHCNAVSGLMVYGKFGFTHSKVEEECDYHTVNASGFAPAFGLGVEKRVSPKFSARLDVEYMASRKKSNYYLKAERGRSLNLRALIVHNVKSN